MSQAKITIVGEDRASKAINDVSRSMEHATARGAAFGVIAGQAFTAIASKAIAFGKESIDAFANVGAETLRLQRYIGGSAESASRLRFAAQESGVGMDSLSKGLGILSKHLAANDKGAKSLGIAYRDATGHIKPMDALLPQLAQKFKDMPNGAEKTALVLKTFGRAGMDLLPFLNRGAKGIEELTKESDKFGLTLSSKDTKAVYENIMAKRTWHAAIEGVQVQLGRYLYPALTAVANAMIVVIPKIREFAGPILKALGDVLSSKVIPALTVMFRVFTDDILPVMRTVGEWIGKHRVLLTSLAVGIGTVVAILKVYQFYQFAVAKATAIWTAAQAALDAVLAANPIAIVVIVIAALAAGLIYAYHHSETFRRICDAAFKGVATAASFMWNNVLKPVFRFLVEAWMAVAGAIVNGAASAFGWVPGIGGKLKKAAAEFNHFRDEVSRALDGIPDKVIHIRAVANIPGYANKQNLDIAHGYASGTSNAARGIALVGESGPELVMFNGGERVQTASQTRGMLSGGNDVLGELRLMRQEIAALRREAPNNAAATGSAVGEALKSSMGTAQRQARARVG